LPLLPGGGDLPEDRGSWASTIPLGISVSGFHRLLRFARWGGAGFSEDDILGGEALRAVADLLHRQKHISVQCYSLSLL
jgi:hypothetical protein